MQIPPFLKKDDLISITCPSGSIARPKANEAKETLTSWGYRVVIGETVGSSYHYFSAKDEVRLKELQDQLDDPNIKAILMGRGGYGLSRIIDQLDFTQFKKQPKWIIGFSDITVIHSHINNHLKIASIHGPMCSAFEPGNENETSLDSLKNMLTGMPVNYPLTCSPYNKNGMAHGVLTGGNLAILAHLTGSVSQLETKGKILFIEDVGEYLYNVDRMILNLKRAGFFNKIEGLICGGFTEIKDTSVPFGQTIYEMILSHLEEFDFPVAFDFPAGHIRNNFPLMFGENYQLNITPDKEASLLVQMIS